jgi:Cdc6-like AAA superfamily ATPase
MRISIIQVFKRVDSTVFFEDPVNNNVIVILNRDEIRFEDLQKNRIKKRLKRKKVWKVVFTILKYCIELLIAFLPSFFT